MDRERVRIVITELFSPDGTLAHYREQYSVSVVESFCNEKADALAEKVIRALEAQFNSHANIAEVALGESQATGSSVQLREGNDGSMEVSAATACHTELEPVVRVGAGEVASVAAAPAEGADAKRPAAPAPVIEAHSAAVGEPKYDQAVPATPSPKAVIQMPRKFSFRIKGGKFQVGVPYDGKLEAFDGAPNAVARVLRVQIPDELGLMSDAADPAHLTGTPKASGDFVISFTYCIDADGADKMALSSSVSVYVNHDPKSLWKDLPSDQADPHWKPDTDSALLDFPQLRLVAASKRGRSHAHEGKFRDDDFRITNSDASGWAIVAVADGAGSAAKSRLGSKIAVGKAVDVLVEKLAGTDGAKLEDAFAGWKRGELSGEAVISGALYPVLGVAAFEACKALEVEASALGVPAKELSTTLLVTAYKSTDSGHVFATYWVGDGGVGVYFKDGSVRLLGKVDSGEFAGQTRFLDSKVMTTEEIANRLSFTVVDDFKALISMTDGITDPYFTTDNNLESGEYWSKLWAEIEPALAAENPAEALLSWLDFWSAGNHDDRTIAVLW